MDQSVQPYSGFVSSATDIMSSLERVMQQLQLT